MIIFITYIAQIVYVYDQMRITTIELDKITIIK